MLVDRAAWHTTRRLNVPENIRLVSQPAHSPELSPAEHLWKALRESAFSNTSFPSIDALEETLCVAINQLADDPYRLRSMTDFPSMRITSYNAD